MRVTVALSVIVVALLLALLAPSDARALSTAGEGEQLQSQLADYDSAMLELDSEADLDAELDAEADEGADMELEAESESELDAEADDEAFLEEEAATGLVEMDAETEGPHAYFDFTHNKFLNPEDADYNPPAGTSTYVWWQAEKDKATAAATPVSATPAGLEPVAWFGKPRVGAAAPSTAAPTGIVGGAAPQPNRGNLPVYVFEQSTGIFTFPNGKKVRCYSGLKQKANVPANQCDSNEGVLPRGEYQITRRADTLHGEPAPHTMILEGNKAKSCGRGLFRIHRGDFPWPTSTNPNPRFNNFYHSAGCIVMPDERDRALIKAPAILQVVAGPWPVSGHVQQLWAEYIKTRKPPRGW